MDFEQITAATHALADAYDKIVDVTQLLQGAGCPQWRGPTAENAQTQLDDQRGRAAQLLDSISDAQAAADDVRVAQINQVAWGCASGSPTC